MIGNPKVVIKNASTISDSMPGCLRMNWMPCFMLVRIGSRDLAGTNAVWIRYNVMITPTKEIPLKVKFQAAPSLTSAMPPSAGPITRARLNWMELSEMAF